MSERIKIGAKPQEVGEPPIHIFTIEISGPGGNFKCTLTREDAKAFLRGVSAVLDIVYPDGGFIVPSIPG